MAKKTFETERLIIRPFEMNDLHDVYRLIYADPEVCEHYTTGTRTLEETREWLTYRVIEPKYSDFYGWAVVRKADNQFIGLVRLGAGPNFWTRFKENPNPRYNDVEVELSFAFGKAYWGKGYATEACKPVIEYAFLELKIPRLVGGADLENERSARLQERLGFYVERGDGGYATRLENHFV
ncbi:GNAT family N-acetyltransferase [Candidatus Poribacteria bacterium]|nr:GNAT family N-acetyltransferase [Candidatus Poribacteria bacterium]